MKAKSVLPPRKAEWEKGTRQVGAFLRSMDGSTVENARNNATEADFQMVCLLMDTRRCSDEFVAALAAEFERITGQKAVSRG